MTSMIEVKVAELSGPALDWAVAQAEGHPVSILGGELLDSYPEDCPCYGNGLYEPSADWGQGGPLIDKHRMSFEDGVTDFYAVCAGGEGYGPAHLVAACRAIVSAALGDTVQVPSELIGGAQ